MNPPTTPAGQPLDKKTFWIGILTLCAAVLLAAHAMQPTSLMPAAHARESVSNNDYSMSTAEAPNGGEVLYILDKRSGGLGLFTWDPQTRTPRRLDVKPIQAAFQ